MDKKRVLKRLLCLHRNGCVPQYIEIFQQPKDNSHVLPLHFGLEAKM